MLKGRFRCLLAARELHYSPEKAIQIFNVCCALHNVCIKYNIAYQDILMDDDDEPQNVGAFNLPETGPISNIAKKIRDNIKLSL